MEDRSQGSGRSRAPRPESSNSANTRMTPTSSTNSSSAHLPARLATNTGTRAPSTGGASLLHERLRERKVESARHSRRRSIDLGTSGERGVQSSPVKAPGGREEYRPSTSSVPAGKGMGVKQIEEQVSTLHKQNFDLKLELYHRRQRQETLERQLGVAEKQIDEQAELQEVNEQLLAELEKRDQAVEEAVSIIVTLEDKVERLMKEREGVRAFEAEYESTYFRPSHDGGPPSSPPQFDDTKLRLKTSVPRMPSFLSEQSEGAEALRSLYFPNNMHSESTLPKLAEESRDGSPDRLDSPRLSVLSESSFLSVYGQKQLMLGAPEDEDEEEDLPRMRRTSSSVEKWIDERPVPVVTPPRPTLQGPKSQFLSITDVMESPLQRLEKLKHSLEKTNGSFVSTRPRPERTSSQKERRRSKEVLRRVLADQNSFEHQHALPPTPDTISTGTLREFKTDALLDARKASGTIFNSTSSFPHPRQYQSDMSLRPRSAGETVTSRRDGHGWDTQEEFTETGSVSSTASTYNGGSLQHPKRAMTPELFTFGSGGNGWGRDVMFNNASVLPAHTSRRYESVRRSSMVEHPRSDDTVGPYTGNHNQYNGDDTVGPYTGNHNQYNGDESPQYPSPASKPFPPDRRSSLSATTKLRKTAPPPSNPPTPTAGTPEKDVRKTSRFSNRFFGGGRSDVPVAVQPPPAPQARPKLAARTQSQNVRLDLNGAEEDRATPPPIRRNRTTQAARPSSAGGFGYDGAGDIEQKTEEGDGGIGAKGKKWFGLKRNNSLKKT
ncbi:hypothetical protein LSUE1_G000362 [Lachnellula suecica]|uniref:Centrosomin N-terminal motif 1 domain-containing protein n=1 Tax=Lachnellula suecica TaxID=602035 RepID=A0A8T9CIE6_9HELO|nr:hypothetical protein LSUE1_G000362 [Lachnellula suecica]